MTHVFAEESFPKKKHFYFDWLNFERDTIKVNITTLQFLVESIFTNTFLCIKYASFY